MSRHDNRPATESGRGVAEPGATVEGASRAQAAPFHLGQWLVLPEQNRIRSARTSRVLEPRLMEVLAYLCRQSPRVVASDELIEHCWPGQYISDNPLHKCVAQLRKALGDDARRPSYIRTVPRRGYAVIAGIRRIEAPGSELESPRWRIGSPYQGLEPYERIHHPVFFGRQAANTQLLPLLSLAREAAFPCVFLMGPRGVGKTSLVNAGLLPCLEAEDHGQPAPRVLGTWTVPMSVDSDEPLLAVFEQWLSEQGITQPSEPVESSGVAQEAGEPVPAEQPAGGDGSLLVIDQVERLFAGSRSRPETVHAFIQLLLTLVRDHAVLLLVVMRNESYSDAMRLPSFRELKRRAQVFDLPEPDAYELHEIISRSAAAAGLRFDTDTVTGKSLDHVLLDDARDAGSVLPVISYTLDHLYRHRVDDRVLSSRVYRSTDGIQGILVSRGEAALTTVSAAVCNAFPSLLHRLIRFDHEQHGRAVCHEAALDALGDAERELALALDAAGLIRARRRDDQIRIALVHDAILERWDRVRGWIEENRSLIQVLDQVRTDCQRWDEAGRPSSLLARDGPTLGRFLRLLEQPAIRLAPSERDFIHGSARLARRRQRMRAATAATLLALLSASLLMVAQYYAVNRELDDANRRAEELITFMISDLKDSLEPLARLDLLDMIGQQVFNHYAGQASPPGSEASLLNALKALNAVGEVRIGQGLPEEARTSFMESGRLLASWSGGDWQLDEMQLVSTQLNYWLGLTYFQVGDLDAAEAYWRTYLSAARDYRQAHPERARWRLETSYALNNLGALASRRGEASEAVELFGESADLKRVLLTAQPDNTLYIAELADTLSWQASSLSQSGNPERADALERESLALSGRLTELEPDNWNWWHRLALAHYRKALALHDAGVVDRAWAHIGEALPIYLRINEREGSQQRYLRELLNAKLLQSRILRHRGDAALAADLLARVRERQAAQTRAGPRPGWLGTQQWVLELEYGLVLAALGQTRAAIMHIDQLLANPDTASAIARGLQARAHLHLGDMLRASGDGARAAAAWRQSLELATTAMDEGDHSIRLAATYVATLDRLGQAQAGADHRRRLRFEGHRDPDLHISTGDQI